MILESDVNFTEFRRSYKKHPVMHGEKAKPLIFDMKNVKRRADGTILKEDRDDPTQQSDSLDGFRYFCNNFLDWFRPVI